MRTPGMPGASNTALELGGSAADRLGSGMGSVTGPGETSAGTAPALSDAAGGARAASDWAPSDCASTFDSGGAEVRPSVRTAVTIRPVAAGDLRRKFIFNS
jgi:hypothetical protein